MVTSDLPMTVPLVPQPNYNYVGSETGEGYGMPAGLASNKNNDGSGAGSPQAWNPTGDSAFGSAVEWSLLMWRLNMDAALVTAVQTMRALALRY